MNLRDKLEQARQSAIEIGVPARRKDADLYRLLSACLSLCEEVKRDRLEDELREAVRVSVDERNPEIWGTGRSASNNGRGRRYVEVQSDAYILVTRYVLEQHDTRNSIYRYAAALREAGRRQIASADLPSWLVDHGGIVALKPRQKTERDCCRAWRARAEAAEARLAELEMK
jgi:hypothetical protein